MSPSCACRTVSPARTHVSERSTHTHMQSKTLETYLNVRAAPVTSPLDWSCSVHLPCPLSDPKREEEEEVQVYD